MQTLSGFHVVMDKGLEDSDGVAMAIFGTGGVAEMMTVDLASETGPVEDTEVLGAPVRMGEATGEATGEAAAEVAEDRVEVAAVAERITDEEVGMNSQYIFS